MKKNKYSGSSFDDCLKEEGIYEEVKTLAQKELAAEGSLESDGASEVLKGSSRRITKFFRWLRHVFNL